MSEIDFCKFFSDIERDPTAIVPRLTVRQFLQAREHLHNCDSCWNRSQKVLEQDPNQNNNRIGFDIGEN